MDTENYLQIMIDSLVQKEELLKQIVDYNEKQQAIITAAEFDDQAFEQNKYYVFHIYFLQVYAEGIIFYVPP